MSSKPAPQKTALCIGLNYPGSGNDLSGCVNDARDWAEALAARGFATQTAFEPDAAQLRALLTDAVGGAKGGDTVVITYSGHGTYVADADGDETDGHDEAICPADVFAGKIVTDDELAGVFQDRARGVRLVFVSDSCHSGTVSRFAVPSFPVGKAPKVRFLPPAAIQLPKSLAPTARGFRTAKRAKLKSTALLLSGCADPEFSFDAWFGDRANGAFSRAAIDALKLLPVRGTYRDWFKLVRATLPSQQYPQSPNLFGTSEQKKWAAL